MVFFFKQKTSYEMRISDWSSDVCSSDLREDGFNDFFLLGDKKVNSPKLFHSYSQGILTARDTWCFNGSNKKVVKNMGAMIDFYNGEVLRFNKRFNGIDQKSRNALVDRKITRLNSSH